MNNGTNSSNAPRRPLTAEDAAFLAELGRDMAAAPTLGQATPRYWVIRDFDYRPAVSGFDDIARVWHCQDYYSLDEIARLCYEDLKRDVSVWTAGDEEYSRHLEQELDMLGLSLDESGELRRESDFDVKEACERALGVSKWDDDEVVYETLCAKFSDGPIFLTQADAEAHLAANHYHYHPDAHPYALTAWRSPRVERLFEILTEVDFDALNAASGQGEGSGHAGDML